MKKIIFWVFVAFIVVGALIMFVAKHEDRTTKENVYDDSTSSASTTEYDTIVTKSQKAGNSITVEQITLTRPGFIVPFLINAAGPTDIAGTSDFLTAGTKENVIITLKKPLKAGDTIRLILYADDGNKRFSATKDAPVLDSSGAAITSDISFY
jgi:hypothetical protein